MQIRRSKEGDIDTLVQLFSSFYKAEEKWSHEKIRRNMDQKRSEYYIGYIDNTAEGALSLSFQGRACEVDALAVKTSRKGHGSRLLQFAEEVARAHHCSKIECHSLECYHAGDFYKKNGWSEEACLPDFFDGKTCFRYGKSLHCS